MNYNTYKYKKDLILSKLMEENIPDNNSIKKYLDKDKVDFNIKPEDKEHIFLECFHFYLYSYLSQRRFFAIFHN